jgi:hypothetical protein
MVTPQPDMSAGFVHKGQIVYALQYDFESPPGGTLIVWLTPHGDPQVPWIESAYSGKRIVTTKPGGHIRCHCELRKVAGVGIYRALPLHPAIMTP